MHTTTQSTANPAKPIKHKTISRLTLHITFVLGFALVIEAVAMLTMTGFSYDAVAQVSASIGCAMAIGAASIYLIVRRSVARPIQQLVEDVRKLQEGDIASGRKGRIDVDIGGAGHEMNALAEQLFRTVAGIRSGIQSLALTTREMRADNADLSARTESQAASLEEAASTMEQISATVSLNADNSHEANTLANQAYQTALQAGDAVDKVVHTMEAIDRSSRQVTEIIGVIDNIAAQTNILALNASVEAARAGERGKGFAIVASEVRSLAHRSAEASRSIRILINEAIEQIESGRTISVQAGNTMETVRQSAKRVANIVQDISGASREQSEAISSMSKAIANLDLSTQKNSALVEQATKTALILEKRVSLLTEHVAGYELGAGEYGNAEEAQVMVKTAIEYLKKNKADALIAAVNEMNNHAFLDRDLYLMILDANSGTLVAHGTNARLVGSNMAAAKDADGYLFAKEMVKIANADGAGWISYRFPHPVTGEIKSKLSYFERCNSLVIACGIYGEGDTT